jgi:large subunit ribosomal protein L14
MILPQSSLVVADNSGAKKLMCIKVLGSNKKFGRVGDVIIGVIKEVLPNAPVKKSEIVRGVIVRVKRNIKRENGMFVKFGDNAVVLLNKDNTPTGTRIFGPIAKEIRDKNFSKLISLAPEVI